MFQFHFHELFARVVFPHGYLAVDFFFMLSGFVLAHAYQERLDDGWPTLLFLRARVIRLYPLYLLAFMMGLAGAFLRRAAGDRIASSGGLLMLTVAGLCILPLPVGVPGDRSELFLFNRPTWSLFYEGLANIFHALLLRKKSLRFLATAAITSGAVQAAFIWKHGSVDFGAERGFFFPALCRVSFAYTAGMALQKVWERRRLHSRISPVAPTVLLLSALALGGHYLMSPIYDIAVTIFVFPCILLLGSFSEPSSVFVRPFHLLGISSYALYVLHYPLVGFLQKVWMKVRHHPANVDAPWPGWIALGLLLIAALLVDRFYDLPIRSFFSRKISAVEITSIEEVDASRAA